MGFSFFIFLLLLLLFLIWEEGEGAVVLEKLYPILQAHTLKYWRKERKLGSKFRTGTLQHGISTGLPGLKRKY